jgi:hypothetical protein
MDVIRQDKDAGLESEHSLSQTTQKGRPGVPEHVADRLREVIEELLLKEPYKGRGGITRLAKAVRVSQPAITLLRQGGGVSHETAIKICQVASIDAQELLGGAYVADVSGRFPGLERCLAYWVHDPDKWSTAAVAAARSGAWPDDTDSVSWAERLDSLDATLASLRDGAARPIVSGLVPKRRARK